MKKQIVTGAVVFLAAASFCYAQQSEQPGLQGKVDLTWSSKYIWRGFDVYGDKSAVHASVDLRCPVSGFGFNVTGHRANSSGYENAERWDFSPYYFGKLFEKEQYEIDYRLAYVYYNYPQQSSHRTGTAPNYQATDLQELNAVLSLPNVFQVKGLVPSYALVKLWPNGSDTVVGARSPSGGTASGFAHIFMLDYAMPFTCPITGLDRKLNLQSEIVFNDGVAPNGANVDQDWSNAVIGASTDFQVEENLYLTPGVFYQATMDSSVNDDKDETWVSLGMSYKF